MISSGKLEVAIGHLLYEVQSTPLPKALLPTPSFERVVEAASPG